MELLVESTNLDDYLSELDEVDFSDPSLKELAKQLFNENQSEIEKVNIL